MRLCKVSGSMNSTIQSTYCVYLPPNCIIQEIAKDLNVRRAIYKDMQIQSRRTQSIRKSSSTHASDNKKQYTYGDQTHTVYGTYGLPLCQHARHESQITYIYKHNEYINSCIQSGYDNYRLILQLRDVHVNIHIGGLVNFKILTTEKYH